MKNLFYFDFITEGKLYRVFRLHRQYILCYKNYVYIVINIQIFFL